MQEIIDILKIKHLYIYIYIDTCSLNILYVIATIAQPIKLI